MPAEREDVEARHVEGRQQRGEHADDPDAIVARSEGRGENLVLAEESSEGRQAGDRDRADQHGEVGPRHTGAKPAHPAHVLLARQRVDHRAGAQEEQRLEEGVRHEMEDARGVGADAQAEEHVAELADRRVGQHALDVVLSDADRGREERRRGAHDGDHLERHGR